MASVSSESHPPAHATITPAQDRINKDIAAVHSEITALVCRRNINALTLTDEDMKRKHVLENDLKKEMAILKYKRKTQARQQKLRSNKKAKLAELCDKHTELKQKLKVRDKP